MTALAAALLAELDDETLDALAERLAPRLANRLLPERPDSWLNTRQAADHIAATPARIHDLVGLRKLTPRHDGRRLLFKRSELDAYVENAK